MSHRTPSRLLRALPCALLVAFAATAIASPALAQDTQTAAPKKPKKKKPKAAPTDAPPADVAPPAPAPTPPPVETPPAPPPEAATPPPAAPASATSDDASANGDVAEKPTKTYYFVGLRYRGDILPKFMMNMFVNEGATVFANSIGAELDIRHDGFSFIPWVSYTSYSTGDMLFWQKGQPDLPQYYSDVKSGLGAIYVGADVLWSKDITTGLQFEYGAGFGIGFLFGSLTDDWVDQVPGGPLTGANGNTYAPCQAVNPSTTSPCNPATHTPPTDNRVNNYQEKNWFNGGSVPALFPHLALPQLGLRYKPIKQLETRVTIGFSLTGFFFGLSADYGLESKDGKKDETKPGNP